MKIHPLITDSKHARRLLRPALQVPLRRGRYRIHAREHLLARTVPGPDRRRVNEAAAIDPQGAGHRPHAAARPDGQQRGRAEGLPRRRAGRGNHLQPDRQDPAPDVRYADRDDGAGPGEQIGYSNLVELWLGIHLDKGARFTDWSRRPLDKRQIDYAIGDVTHLADISPRCSNAASRPGAATGSTTRWSGWPIRPITATIPNHAGSGSRHRRAAIPMCSAA
jgi:ribonuclease D